MALNASTMATEIVNNLKALNPRITGNVESQLLLHYTAICQGIITRIQADAVVNSSVAVASVTGVVAGAENSGPGTGTATGSIT